MKIQLGEMPNFVLDSEDMTSEVKYRVKIYKSL